MTSYWYPEKKDEETADARVAKCPDPSNENRSLVWTEIVDPDSDDAKAVKEYVEKTRQAD